MMDIPRLCRTVRPLRTSQVLWRLRYLAQRAWEESGLSCVEARYLRRVPADIAVVERFEDPWPQHRVQGRFEALKQRRLTLLHQTKLLEDCQGWRMLSGCNADRLWTSQFHHHEWFVDLAAMANDRLGEAGNLLSEYLRGWLATCGMGKPGFTQYPWNGYVIASRIASWCRIHLLSRNGLFKSDPDLEREFLRSLWMQADYLHGHLEWDIRGNHLIRDALGLAWAARFFKETGGGSGTMQWLETSRRLASEQVLEQVLADGGHFERSPMYHALVLADILQLAVLLGEGEAKVRLLEAAQRMAEFLAWVRHPDGDIALFNDGGFNGAPKPEDVLRRVSELADKDLSAGPRIGGRYFKDFGLAVWHGDPWTIFFDMGEIGPPCQSGHAHADTLAFECSFKGRRLFVDPGAFAYDPGEKRRLARSTLSHNTVAVDGLDSSEVWHIFRVGRRARPLDREVVFGPSSMKASGAHDGYRHLTGNPTHRRTLEVSDGGALRWVDRVEGFRRHRMEAGLLLAPAWAPKPVEAGWELQADSLRLTVRIEGPASMRFDVVPAVYHPEFGLESRTKRLRWTWEGDLPFEAKVEIQ